MFKKSIIEYFLRHWKPKSKYNYENIRTQTKYLDYLQGIRIRKIQQAALESINQKVKKEMTEKRILYHLFSAYCKAYAAKLCKIEIAQNVKFDMHCFRQNFLIPSKTRVYFTSPPGTGKKLRKIVYP